MPPLHVVAPAFDPAVVGGAGVSFVQLVDRLLAREPDVRIFLNAETVPLFPAWRDAVTEVAAGNVRRPWAKAWNMLRLLHREAPWGHGVGCCCWFPFGAMLPRSFAGCGVTTLHDTLWLDIPGSVPRLERVFRAGTVKGTLRRTTIVTSSEFSRRRINRHLGVDAIAIPLAPVLLPEPSYDRVPTEPYVFYPAKPWPHKNHRFLLDTWRSHAELRRFALVFTTGAGSALRSDIARARDHGARIIELEHITAAEVSGLYRQAVCSVFPSLYEGFGLPVLEALELGCPILISDQGALPEAVAPGYPFVLPLDSAAWAQAILSEPRRLQGQLQSFTSNRTWDDCAREYADVFDRSRGMTRETSL